MTICLAGIATDYTIANDTILNTQLITQFLVSDTILTIPLLCNDTILITHAILVHKVLIIPIGMVERCHRTIEDVIRKVMTDQTDWLLTLNSVLFSI